MGRTPNCRTTQVAGERCMGLLISGGVVLVGGVQIDGVEGRHAISRLSVHQTPK